MLTIQQLINRVEHEGDANTERNRTLAILMVAQALENVSSSLDKVARVIDDQFDYDHQLTGVIGLAGVADAIEKLAQKDD